MSKPNKYYNLSKEEFWLTTIDRRISFCTSREEVMAVYRDLIKDMPTTLRVWIVKNKPEDLEWFDKIVILV